jgi:hypothetical protein
MEHLAGLIVEIGPNIVFLAELYLAAGLLSWGAFLASILWINRR